MKTIMTAKSPHDSSFSFSRRYFHWKKKALDEDDEEEILNISSSSHFPEDDDEDVGGENDEDHPQHHYNNLRIKIPVEIAALEKKKNSKSKFKSAITILTKNRSLHNSSSLGTRMVGTLFGYRRGHVHFAFQEDSKLSPVFLIELATPTSVLVREMASGVVRIALECEKKLGGGRKGLKLLEEPIWRTYCNGRKCGYAYKHECGSEEWKILKALEPISMGAGVLPMPPSSEFEGELMYMRTKYERVVGSKDSEAFYMMNPVVGSAGPELSIYLLRV